MSPEVRKANAAIKWLQAASIIMGLASPIVAVAVTTYTSERVFEVRMTRQEFETSDLRTKLDVKLDVIDRTLRAIADKVEYMRGQMDKGK